MNSKPRGGEEDGAPDMRVLFLHDGEVAFLGTPEEFYANTSPAVTYMTRTQATTPHASAADPWDGSRRPKHEL
jgi:hypothetical protein